MILPPLPVIGLRRLREKGETATAASDGPQFRPSTGLASAASSGVAAGPGPVAAVPLPEAPSLPVWTAPVTGPVFTADRPILERFAADIRTAPDIVGELVALYIEQHRHLAVRFVACALGLRRDAADQILAAARRREAYGLQWLAILIFAAMDLATASNAEEETPLPALADLVDLDADGGDLAALDFLRPAPRETAPHETVLSADDLLSGEVIGPGEGDAGASLFAILDRPLNPLWDILPSPLPT